MKSQESQSKALPFISQEVFIMARRNGSNEEKYRRKLVEIFLSENPIKDPNNI
jgi:hypothetical protein